VTEAKQDFQDTPGAFRPGVKGLLSNRFAESAEQARRGGDEGTAERHRAVETALFVFGLGIDVACPRRAPSFAPRTA
jgi:hypothetical protein